MAWTVENDCVLVAVLSTANVVISANASYDVGNEPIGTGVFDDTTYYVPGSTQLNLGLTLLKGQVMNFLDNAGGSGWRVFLLIDDLVSPDSTP